MATLELESMLILVVAVVIIFFLLRELIRKVSEINRLKLEHEGQIKAARKDSNDRQRSTIKGQISETLAPWSMDAVNSVKELNFLGNPIDFLGFKGLDGEGEVEIKFIEVKSGKSNLNKNQRRVRDAVKAKRIEWVEVRISEIQIEEKTIS
jgi:predicted Holliday junction resolvase-like endonuclease